MKRRNFTITTLLLSSLTPGALASPARTGHVFAMTNESGQNHVVVYDRSADGTLTLSDVVATEGAGSGGKAPLDPGDALGAQSPLLLSDDGRWLFAVNAGSDEISVFRVNGGELELTDVEGSGGDFPASVTYHDGLLYVLNAGGDGNITGFRLTRSGQLRPIPQSTRSLDVGGNSPPYFLVSPAQLGFDPSGNFLILTIKGSNEIRVFPMDGDARPSAMPVLNASSGTAPFGFDFDPYGNLLVVEPFGVEPPMTGGAGAVTSYELQLDGSLVPLFESVPNEQTASCWLAANSSLPYAYVTNNASATVSGYSVAPDGGLTLLSDDGVSGYTDANPVDLAIAPDGDYLYTVNAGEGTISMFAIDPDTGALNELGVVEGLPADDGAVGIAVR